MRVLCHFKQCTNDNYKVNSAISVLLVKTLFVNKGLSMMVLVGIFIYYEMINSIGRFGWGGNSS